MSEQQTEQPANIQLLGIAHELDKFQRLYEQATCQPGRMPGNDLYSEKLMQIVNKARAAIAAKEVGPVAAPESKPNIGTKRARGDYFLCQCDKCGWLGSSEETRASIDYWHGDGDYSCPSCGAIEPEEVDSASTTFNVMLSAAQKPESAR